MTLAAQRPKRKQARPEGQGAGRATRASLAAPRPNAGTLLEWYDRQKRLFPWRTPAGAEADPYRVWISEIMLQQTGVKVVAPYFERFLARWPTVQALAAASLEDVLTEWAGLGYYARARNLHACARELAAHWGGQIPDSETALCKLPGIGSYTAAAIAAIAFDVRTAAVDSNGERVLARVFAVGEPLPAAKPRLRSLATMLLPASRSGDFAQALMDLGALICTPKRPSCMLCPWRKNCAGWQSGYPEIFPHKQQRQAGELRRGAAFVLLRADEAVLLRQRPSRGLLGGMMEVPNSAWRRDFDEAAALAEAPRPTAAVPEWQRVAGLVEHAFTHFPLQLVVYRATVSPRARPPAGTRWAAVTKLAQEALPSVMRKVLAHAMPSLQIRPSPMAGKRKAAGVAAAGRSSP